MRPVAAEAPDGVDGRLGLNFGRFDSKYFGRWEIDLVREQRNGRNRKIHGSTYLGAGRLAVIKVGDWEIETPHRGPHSCTSSASTLYCCVLCNYSYNTNVHFEEMLFD